ncbi:MAG TPA: AI-2E family transporter [Ramlibacter sp.]|jgi:predicted PurR-regulated permease PerM|nr:AI-2E family transporter [Ramlibacter sp.]
MRPISPASSSGATRIIAATCVLGLLYVGREILAPIALASVLSLVLAPLKRKLASGGIGQSAGAAISVLFATGCIALAGIFITSQFVSVATELPQYKEAVRAKLQRVMDVTIRPLERIQSDIAGVVPHAQAPAVARAQARSAPATRPPPPEAVPPQESTAALVFSSLWGPLSQAGIVLVLLVFILLGHETLRERMIRLAGEAEVGRTMQAIDDAAQGVSRFFFSQLVVNATFGVVLGLALWMVGIPHAALWGALGGLARFIPYVGALAAGAAIAAFAAAVDPGWSLMFWSIGCFLVLEVVVAHFVEPQVYGQSAGLAPLGVIVSALFWGAIWGPLGLLLSTPMTLCLVVAGRHIRALEPITVIFGETPGLTEGLRLYQQALSGEPQNIIAAARRYLRRSNFARYCDQVVLPALALASADARQARIGRDQQERVRLAIREATEALSRSASIGDASRRRRSTSLLDADVGAHLAEVREKRLRIWPGPRSDLDASLVICVGLGSERDELIGKLLEQSLRDEGIESRSISVDLGSEYGVSAALASNGQGASGLVSTVVLAYPLEDDHELWQSVSLMIRDSYPYAMVLTVRPPYEEGLAEEALVRGPVDLVVRSFAEVVAFVLAGRAAAR